MFSKVGRGERVTGIAELFDLGAYLRTEAPRIEEALLAAVVEASDLLPVELARCCRPRGALGRETTPTRAVRLRLPRLWRSEPENR